MLENTFCHIPGISPSRENDLWAQGIRSWDECLVPGQFAGKTSVVEELHRSRESLQRSDLLYFSRLLPAREHWRLFSAFRNSVAYLDIETTGLGRPSDHITAITLYDGRAARTYVHGVNLPDFVEEIGNYQLLVTYNGKCFDIPFIERHFGIKIPHAHLDLMYLLRSLGITGGLKGCEKKLGIDRGDLEGVDGSFAVLLWREYERTGSPEALETLLAYNAADAVNLEILAVMMYNLKLARLPSAPVGPLSLPTPPVVLFQPDHEVINRLKHLHSL